MLIPRRLEVKTHAAPGVADLWRWRPENHAVFYRLDMRIGFAGEASSAPYSIAIATPEGLARQVDGLYKAILQPQYGWKRLKAHIDRLLANVPTHAQHTIAAELRTWFCMGYQDSPGLPPCAAPSKKRGGWELRGWVALERPDIDQWVPGADEVVFYGLDFYVGRAGEKGADRYTVTVANPQGLLESCPTNAADQLCRIMLLRQYSWGRVAACLQSMLASIPPDDAWEAQLRLQECFGWEYGVGDCVRL